MKTLPFDKPGRFYRGNLHTHSTRSDGREAPEAVIAAYRDHGYDFISLTDHFMERFGWPMVDTRAFRTEHFTTLIGAELHAPALENGERWHILAVGLPLDFAPCPPDERGPALAMRAREAGAFVAIAHPYWYNLTLQDALSIEAAHAVEVWNTGCAVEVSRGDSWYMSDMLSGRGWRLSACATDDAHFKVEDYRGGWVQVRAASLDPDAILAALKAGHYYSSNGPELRDVRVEPASPTGGAAASMGGDVVASGESAGQIRISCSPARSIVVTGRGAKSEALLGSGLTEAVLPLQKFAGAWCRVTVTDAAGRQAWTNPIWLG